MVSAAAGRPRLVVSLGGIGVDFHRYHGLGNDYLVIDPAHFTMQMNERSIRLICHRHFRVGSDGILYGPLWDERGDAWVRIFNPDGSEVEKSGNGVRIFARYMVDAGYHNWANTFEIFTKGGRVTAFVDKDKIRVDMGPATFWSDQIPVTGDRREVIGEWLPLGDERYQVTCLSIGNPHCVIPVPAATSQEAQSLGPMVERHPWFPNRINMQLLQVLDRQNIQIEIWERGAGYTLASGTSSCAAAAAAHRLGMVDPNVTVHMPGGTLGIKISADYQIELIGPVTAVCAGVFGDDFKQELAAL